jgi:phosphoglycerate dehydrogenase-like enzyme
MDQMMWRIVGLSATFAAATLAKKAVDITWVAIAGEDPPSADDPDVSLRKVVAFTAATAAAVAVAQLVVNRGIAKARAGSSPETAN